MFENPPVIEKLADAELLDRAMRERGLKQLTPILGFGGVLINPYTFAVTGDYQIARSLRFNSADSARLSKATGAGTSAQIFTISTWFKRALFGANKALFGAIVGTSNAVTQCYFNSSDQLVFYSQNSGGGVLVNKVTNAVYRDPSAWMHIVIAIDTTQATAANRTRIYINGVEITSFSATTDPTQNASLTWNAATMTTYLGVMPLAAGALSGYFDGFLADLFHIDGAQRAATEFGEFDTTTGVWKPKLYILGGYGTNGFRLSFADNTNTTTIAEDAAGSNDYTATNISVTAGVGNDSLTDTPTDYGTDTGAGGEVRGNFCTANPLRTGGSVITEGNLKVIANVSAWRGTVGTFGVTSGKWYWEFTQSAAGLIFVGVCDKNAPLTSYLGASSVWGIYNGDGKKTVAGAALAAYGASWTTNDVMGVALDMTAGTLVIYKNGVSQGTLTNTLAGLLLFPWLLVDGTAGGNYNFGQRPFAHTPPADHKALCTQNFSTPTIVRGDDAFIANLRTGTGAAFSVTGKRFQPGLAFIKRRDAVAEWYVYDSIRGVQKQLTYSAAVHETTEAQGLTAFNADGFSGGTLAAINTNAGNYFDFLLRAGAAYGFEAVLHSGTAANKTVAHSLGIAPRFMLNLQRTGPNVRAKKAWHISMAGTHTLNPTDTAAATSEPTVWNSTVPSSTVFSIGTHVAVNESGSTHVTFLFLEIEGFSRIDSYTGNASADGPFVWCGFRPAFVLLKNTSAVGNWFVLDNKRSTSNPASNNLYLDLSNAEATVTALDFLSNGFKVRTATAAYNGSGNTIAFVAFAENPFKYARAA